MSFDLKSLLGSIAPTVATALGGPLAGSAVAAIGEALGLKDATAKSIETAFMEGKLTADQISELKKLEMQFKNDESERGFKYAELTMNDRASARAASVSGGTQIHLFWMSIVLLIITLGTEVYVLLSGYPEGLSEIIVGRVLGLMDAVAMMVLAYWYGTNSSSARKTELISMSDPVK